MGFRFVRGFNKQWLSGTSACGPSVWCKNSYRSHILTTFSFSPQLLSTVSLSKACAIRTRVRTAECVLRFLTSVRLSVCVQMLSREPSVNWVSESHKKKPHNIKIHHLHSIFAFQRNPRTWHVITCQLLCVYTQNESSPGANTSKFSVPDKVYVKS